MNVSPYPLPSNSCNCAHWSRIFPPCPRSLASATNSRPPVQLNSTHDGCTQEEGKESLEQETRTCVRGEDRLFRRLSSMRWRCCKILRQRRVAPRPPGYILAHAPRSRRVHVARGGSRGTNLVRSRSLVDLKHANIVHALDLRASDAGEVVLVQHRDGEREGHSVRARTEASASGESAASRTKPVHAGHAGPLSPSTPPTPGATACTRRGCGGTRRRGAP